MEYFIVQFKDEDQCFRYVADDGSGANRSISLKEAVWFPTKNQALGVAEKVQGKVLRITIDTA